MSRFKVLTAWWAWWMLCGHPGIAADRPSGLLVELIRWPERVVITDATPEFGWVVPADVQGGRQTGYQIQVARGDSHEEVWDSGRIAKPDSINVEYRGKALVSDQTYRWRVRAWGKGGSPTPYSEWQIFHTGGLQQAYRTTTLPLIESEVPVERKTTAPGGGRLFDFGRAWFGYLTVDTDGGLRAPLTFRYGEKEKDGRVDMEPGECIRAGSATVPANASAGSRRLRVPFTDYHRPPAAVPLPDERGEVLPFRYIETEPEASALDAERFTMHALHYPFDDQEANFRSSNKWLNRVWELCKHSIKATTFAGVYVDGDRERIPYEADAYINQLGHYYTDREFALARHSHEYLLDHPTWPTEWKLHSIFMAWADYMHTGNTESLEQNYTRLKGKLFLGRVDADTGLFRSFPEFAPERGNADLVDWPEAERSGYVMEEHNMVLHAFLYRALGIMGKIALLVNQTEDARQFTSLAQKVRSRVRETFYDPARGLYRDGQKTTHAGFHANMFALAFDLATPEQHAPILAYLKSQGMACSVYAAQYFLEGLFESGEAATAIGLMIADDTNRSWRHMLEAGASITWEAWDKQYKPNLDWNHAWGAAPANLLPRYVLGVRPLAPGYARTLIAPQLGQLDWIEGRVPTIRGRVEVRVKREARDIKIRLNTPGNMQVDFAYGAESDQVKEVTLNGNPVALAKGLQPVEIHDIPPGTADIVIRLR